MADDFLGLETALIVATAHGSKELNFYFANDQSCMDMEFWLLPCYNLKFNQTQACNKTKKKKNLTQRNEHIYDHISCTNIQESFFYLMVYNSFIWEPWIVKKKANFKLLWTEKSTWEYQLLNRATSGTNNLPINPLTSIISVILQSHIEKK